MNTSELNRALSDCGGGARRPTHQGRVLRLRLPAVCVTLICAVALPSWRFAEAVDEDADDGPLPVQPAQQLNASRFGPSELLVEKLIRSRDAEGLLSRLQPDSSGVLPDFAIETLLALFAAPADVFVIGADDRPVSAVGLARQWLLDSERATQRAWDAAVGPRAEAALIAAMQAGDSQSLSRVARMFPLTGPALKAEALTLLKDRLRSDSASAAAGAERMRVEYRGTHLESQALRYADLLQAADRDSVETAQSRLSVEMVSASAVSPPWPRTLWTWHEQSWTFPGSPQPDAGSVLDAVDPSLPGPAGKFSNWKPIFWGPDVVLRTPFRLVGLDPLSGIVRWFLPTSTYRSPGENEPRRTEGRGFFGDASEERVAQLRSSAWGTLSADNEYLYFVDRFDLFESAEASDPFRRGVMAFRDPDDVPPAPPFAHATRLVALRRSAGDGPPVLAWTAGEPGSFTYSVLTGAGLADVRAVQDRTALEAATSASTSDPGNPDAPPEDFPRATLPVESPPELVAGSVTGHRFLHAPVTRGEQLFVLTHAGEQYWLNRLERSSGRVVWQQPVCFSSESPEDDLAGNPIAGANICLLVEDLVICCLQHGVLIGVEADDGRLMWASTVLDEPETSPVPGFGIPQRFRPYEEPSPVVMLPAVSSGLLIGSHPDSRFVSAVDARSGEILWRSPKSPHGVEPGGRNSDRLIAGVTADQVILTGERHCRSLDLRSGHQNWIVELDAVGGRPECSNQRCLVPLSDGRVQVIDVSSGSLVSPPSVMTLPARLPVSGAICGNEDIVVLSSPASISAFARSDVMQRATLPDWAASTVRDGELTVLRQTQSMLMAGDLSGAQQLLESELEPASVAAGSPDANRVWMEVGAARAELMLQSWGQELESVRAGDVRSSNIRSGDLMQKLAALPLRPDQELRAAVLSLLDRPSTALDAEAVAGLASYSDWKRPVTLHGSWRTRPDRLLADRLSVATVDATAREVAFEALSRKAARALAAGWILEPSHAHDAQSIAALADWFAARTDAATAELLLLSATQSDSLSESSRAELQSALNALRSRNRIPGFTPSQDGTSEGALSSGLRGLTAEVAERSSLKIEVEPFLRLPSPEWTELQGGVRLIGLPEHLRLDYYFSSGEDSNAVELVSFDPADGTIRDRIPVTAAISRQTLTMTPLESGESCPSLFPVADRGRMEMFQLAAPGEAGLLWQRKLETPSDARSERPVELGPIGADHFVWASDGVLHGTHPLTGEDLWTRSLLWTWDEAPLLRTHRIFGDAKATVVLSSDGAGFERFATRTGERLGRGSLAISRTHEPLAVGRFLAFVSADGVLQVIDGTDGRDILADETPVRIARQNSARTFSLLPRGRFATVNDQNEVILVDTQRGGIVFRTNVGAYLSTSLVFGVTAFERRGRLFVGLDDEQDRPGDMLVQFSRLADPRLGLGPLLCLDPESGEVQWSVRTERAVVPRIAGDPTDLLVTWTLYRPSFQSRTDGDGDRLNIRVFDSRSGRELASEASLSTAAPFRCSHDANAGVIRLFTRDCEITIRPLQDGETPDQRP